MIRPFLLAMSLAGCGGILDLGSNSDETTTPDADDGHARRVFVTSTQYDGNLGGIAGADAKCASHATAAGLGGTYLAWLSTSQTSPAQRMTQHPSGYALVDGTPIANDWADLVDGSIAHDINITETGAPYRGPGLTCRFVVGVWSGTTNNGTMSTFATTDPLYATCGDWTSSGYSGVIGGVYDSTGVADQLPYWSEQHCIPSCNSSGALYCVEQ